MWGDNPDDYRRFELDDEQLGTGILEITDRTKLPSSERLDDDWVVDLRWIFRNELYAVACIATGIRFTGEGFRECPQHIEDSAAKIVEILWERYRKNVAKNT